MPSLNRDPARDSSDAHSPADPREDSEFRFRNIVENTLDWIWEMDLDGWHTYSNHQLERILGYTHEELSALELHQLIHPEDMKEVEARLPALIAEKRGWEAWVVRFRHKHVGYRYLESSAEPIFDDEGDVCGFRGIDRDVTDRHQAQQQVLETESRLKEAQRIAKVGNWERDLATNDVWWSDETYRIFGMPEGSDVSYESVLERVHADDRQRVQKSVSIAVEQGTAYEIDCRLVLPDGTVKVVEGRAFVRSDEHGEPARLVGTIQDITERVRLEREIVAIGELERERIGADLHDGLGQELTGISLGLQNLSQELERNHSPHAETVRYLAGVAQRAINDLRRVARLLSPGLSSDVRLCHALESLAAEVAEQSGVRVHVECSDHHASPEDSEISTHLYRLAQEAVNNALKHGRARNIEVRYGVDEQDGFIEVLDDGVGIRAEDSLVEGMGLRSMRYRARTLNGELSIGPRVEGGTRVFCAWPASGRPASSSA